MFGRILILALLAVSLVNASSDSNDSEWLSNKLKESNQFNITNTTNNLNLTTISPLTTPALNETLKTNHSNNIIIKSNSNPTTQESFDYTTNFLNKIFDRLDKHTLILILTFLIGLVLISCLIGISICIFNSLNTCGSGAKKSSLPSHDLATNPAYDSVKYDPNFDSCNTHGLSRADIIIHPGSDIPLLPPKLNNNLNSTSSMSCSTVSINSVIYNKTPGTVEVITGNQQIASKNRETVPSQPSTPIKASNIRSSISNIVNTFSSTPTKPSKKNEDKSSSENERSCLLDETDSIDQPNETSISNRKPIFQSQPKTGQQILREQKITKHPSYLRTHSEINSASVENNRLSAASSRSSIVMPNIPLNFDQIRDDIDDLAINKEKLVSRTSLNKLMSKDGDQAGDQDSTNTSIADIYIQELINKHQQSTQKNNNGIKKLTKQENSASVSSVISENTRERLQLKRLSINIDISKVNFEMNPGGAQSTTNLDKNASVSNYTMGSEKSCY